MRCRSACSHCVGRGAVGRRARMSMPTVDPSRLRPGMLRALTQSCRPSQQGAAAPITRRITAVRIIHTAFECAT